MKSVVACVIANVKAVGKKNGIHNRPPQRVL